MRGARAQHSAAAGDVNLCDKRACTNDCLQVMLRQAAEDKEAAIKMRAALQAELAQQQPRHSMQPAASAVATSQDLDRSRAQLEAWAASHAAADAMQRMLHALCNDQPAAPSPLPLHPALQADRVVDMCATMAAASALLLLPVAAAPVVENRQGTQQANERSARALAQAVAARDAALSDSAALRQVQHKHRMRITSAA